MTVFVLPTKGTTPYRGKNPHRARSISGYTSRSIGRHIELMDGTRLWSADDKTPEFSAGSLGDDYSAIKASAVAMTGEQYETLLAASETAASVIGYCGRTKRDEITARARRLALSIVAPTVPAIGLVFDGTLPREGESPARMWIELTEAEKREATQRGFPRGGDIRYFERKGYRDGELKLSRWHRLRTPGLPCTA